eukprot:CAMPEP_0177199612 /NCGR_PEP_ID=MMETSP0367-20130122/25769_1 /TAXON_ID=447022 ORGANISM="Scrippsiella hangoei-like, Strain SHHI-4" /NCGR_SAMPLE_ID=MMETSP0367 /ASSEMBLY_ACC=CAM_ASM_000362 /LENGTH=31 /DNA_ID= /DNA_START= /DNA_END= /DNA_ORIENTATION=
MAANNITGTASSIKEVKLRGGVILLHELGLL